MSFSRRFVASAVVFLLSCSFLHSQPLPEPSDPVPNWTAPPFWTPPRALAVEKWKQLEGQVEPFAVEAVPTGPLPFFGIAPCRLLDTRSNVYPLGGGGPFAADETRPYSLPNKCGIPVGAQAVSLNVTATNTGAGAFGHIKLWPSDQAEPNVSTLNYPGPGATIANAAIVPLSATGNLSVKSGNTFADVILDVNGYYAPIFIVNTVNGLSGAVTLAAGSNVSITPSGQTLTIANTAPAAWSLSGNNISPGQFLGTTNNQQLEFRVNGLQAMRFQPNIANAPNVVAGPTNSVTSGATGATIAGGGGGLGLNLVTDTGGTVGGGANNRSGDNAGTTADTHYATVSGGQGNIASGPHATVAGGAGNTASGGAAIVIGGAGNIATGAQAIAGGNGNIASGNWSTTPGGQQNTAAGQWSFAAGQQAKANHLGVFVWNDGSPAQVASTGINQFIVRASGGVWLGTTNAPNFDIAADFLRTSTGAHLTIGGVWTNNSDRAAKENVALVDREEVLSRLATLPISSWNYRAEGEATRHMGPMAQDFAAAFGLGGDERSIGTIDADGVALAAIQALYEIVNEKDAEIDALKARLLKLEAKVE